MSQNNQVQFGVVVSTGKKFTIVQLMDPEFKTTLGDTILVYPNHFRRVVDDRVSPGFSPVEDISWSPHMGQGLVLLENESGRFIAGQAQAWVEMEQRIADRKNPPAPTFTTKAVPTSVIPSAVIAMVGTVPAPTSQTTSTATASVVSIPEPPKKRRSYAQKLQERRSEEVAA